MLQPKKTKFRKAFKGKINGNAKGGTALNFGSYGLKALEPERITARQIEAARRAITRHIKRQGRLWIRVFPDVPVSKKPAEVRQGKGKGSIEYWAARVKPGRILFELDGVPGPLAASAFERGVWMHRAASLQSISRHARVGIPTCTGTRTSRKLPTCTRIHVSIHL